MGSDLILLIDNYDSFVHNVARYCRRFGFKTTICRSDQLDATEVARLNPEAIIVSPGPCSPNEAGVSLEIVREFSDLIPMFGICLGHQVIAQAFGARIVRSETPMHGRSSLIEHDGSSLFAGIGNPFEAARYHSLVVEPSSLPDCLIATAKTTDGSVMALRHKRLPIFGVQFHPESILSSVGYKLLAQFFKIANLKAPRNPTFEDELRVVENVEQDVVPTSPVTF